MIFYWRVCFLIDIALQCVAYEAQKVQNSAPPLTQNLLPKKNLPQERLEEELTKNGRRLAVQNQGRRKQEPKGKGRAETRRAWWKETQQGQIQKNWEPANWKIAPKRKEEKGSPKQRKGERERKRKEAQQGKSQAQLHLVLTSEQDKSGLGWWVGRWWRWWW